MHTVESTSLYMQDTQIVPFLSENLAKSILDHMISDDVISLLRRMKGIPKDIFISICA